MKHNCIKYREDKNTKTVITAVAYDQSYIEKSVERATCRNFEVISELCSILLDKIDGYVFYWVKDKMTA